MFQEFSTKTLESKFIKNLLYSTPLPIYRVVRDGDYVFAGNYYIYKNNIIKINYEENESTHEVMVDGSGFLHYIPDNLDSSIPSSDAVLAEYTYIAPYVFGKMYPQFTERFISKFGYYDSETHETLGNYLRCIRNMYDVDLMPFYNCVSGQYANNLCIETTHKSTTYYLYKYHKYDMPVKLSDLIIEPMELIGDISIHSSRSIKYICNSDTLRYEPSLIDPIAGVPAVLTSYYITFIDGSSAWEPITIKCNSETVITGDMSNLLITNYQQVFNYESLPMASDNTFITTILGDGETASFKIAHNLNTYDIFVQVYDLSDKTVALVDTKVISNNTIQIDFNKVIIKNAAYRILCTNRVDQFFSTEISGDGGTQEFNVTHNLNSQDIMIHVYNLLDNSFVKVETERVDNNNIRIGFRDIPTAQDRYKVFCTATSTEGDTYCTTITGDGEATKFTITHKLNTRDIFVQVYDVKTHKTILTDILQKDDSSVVLEFLNAPTNTEKYRVLCISIPTLYEDVQSTSGNNYPTDGWMDKSWYQLYSLSSNVITTPVYEFVNKNNNKVKLIKIPIKLNQEYTIALETDGDVYLAPLYILNGRKLTVLDAKKNSVDLSKSLGIEVKCVSAPKYKHPFTYKVNLTHSNSMYKYLSENERCLYLIIQIPISKVTTMTVLEGDYTRHDNCVAHFEWENFEFEHQRDKDRLLLSNLSLLKLNDGKSYAFSNRLIEYLTKNVITSLEEIDYNITLAQNAQKVRGYDGYTKGVWDEKLRMYYFKYLQNNKKIEHCDLNGYIDKTAEKEYII